MKCPKCGAEMPVGSLYCEQCGEDIHIVPDFEPQVEFNIEQTIHGIAKDIKSNPKETEESETPEEQGELLSERRKLILSIVFTCIVAVALMIGGIMLYQYNSLPVQLKKAENSILKEDYDKAISHYTRALELDSREDAVNIKFALAEAYFLKNNKVEYEFLLREIAKDKYASQEQIESAYGKLIAIYRAREDFKSINELLQASENEEVLRTYQNYVAIKPEFSIPEGYYTSLQPLKLSAYGTGRIFYTLDGSEPNENSIQYTAPIILDDGDYVVSAYFVNDYGFASEIVTKSYHVEIEELPMPELKTVSGEYEFPTNIEVLGDTDNVYYTTDGTEPTMSSTQYTGPIPMPLGKSSYKFVRLTEGRTSSVVERTFTLKMNTEYTPEEAVEDVVAYLIESGKIKDESGYFEASDARYQYEYRFVTNIEQIDDFYVISEVYRDAEGIGSRTGNHFAVNAYTKELYKLQIDEFNQYHLVEIEGQSYREG